MTDEQRHLNDALIRIFQFGTDNAGSFTGIATATFAEIGTIIEGNQATGGEQMSSIGDSGEQFELKDIKREVVRRYVSVTSRTSKSMRYLFPGIEEQFKMPKGRNDADILSAARAFVTNGTPIQPDFEGFGLAKTWFADMTAAADAWELTFGATASAQADRAEATAEMYGWEVQGGRARRVLDGIVKNVFVNDPGKLAAWLSASHIEQAPRRTVQPSPPTP